MFRTRGCQANEASPSPESLPPVRETILYPVRPGSEPIPGVLCCIYTSGSNSGSISVQCGTFYKALNPFLPVRQMLIHPFNQIFTACLLHAGLRNVLVNQLVQSQPSWLMASHGKLTR